MASSSQCDIGIIGGGLVGLCAALALQHTEKQISIIEASPFKRSDNAGLNAGSIVLSYASIQIFKALDIWPLLKPQAEAVRHIHISSQGHWGISRLRASDYDIPAFGYVIESRHLTTCLLQQVEASERIELITPAAFEYINTAETVDIGYQYQDQSQQLCCQLALIADGAHSQARTSLDIAHKTVDYGQSAVITHVEFDRPMTNHAYERFTGQGPLAMLPLAGNRYACVWVCNHQSAQSLGQTDEAVFITALQDCFGYRMGFIESIGKRFCMPLTRTQALAPGKGRCLLIGNAANSLHPVAGQGFNLALRDVANLYELLAKKTSFDSLITEFQRSRQIEQQLVAQLGDSLISLFSNQLPLLRHARAAGLAVLDLIPTLKTQVVMTGMGFSFAGNALLRGHL